MTEVLVDQEGYPRADIDIYQVRIARNRIICKYVFRSQKPAKLDFTFSGLRNDLKKITQQIEEALHNLHSQQREGLGLPEDKPSILSEFDENSIPFAKIGTVTDGSPADKAVSYKKFATFYRDLIMLLQGLKVDDLILGFGSLRPDNFTNLQDIAKVVQHSVDREIPLCVKRSNRLFPLTLVPKAWDGRGLLGCVLLPYDTLDR